MCPLVATTALASGIDSEARGKQPMRPFAGKLRGGFSALSFPRPIAPPIRSVVQSADTPIIPIPVLIADLSGDGDGGPIPGVLESGDHPRAGRAHPHRHRHPRFGMGIVPIPGSHRGLRALSAVAHSTSVQSTTRRPFRIRKALDRNHTVFRLFLLQLMNAKT